MAIPVRLGGASRKSPLGPLLVTSSGLSIGAAACLAWPQTRDVGGVLLVLAALAWIPTAIEAAICWSRRRRLEIAPTGFILRGRWRRREYRDDQVYRLTCSAERQRRFGSPQKPGFANSPASVVAIEGFGLRHNCHVVR